MPASRTRLLLLLAVSGSLAGLMRAQELLTLSSLSVLIWLLLEWILFRSRIELVARHLSCQRTVCGNRHSPGSGRTSPANRSGHTNRTGHTLDTGSEHAADRAFEAERPDGTLWAGRRVTVETTLQLDSPLRLPHVRCQEALPENLQVVSGQSAAIATVARGRPLTLSFEAVVPGAGRVAFRGVCLRLSDRFGLYSTEKFVPARQSFRVLPASETPEPGHPVTKRLNNQMPPGIHRLQRPGGGSELLEIRDYVPGDPPKSIAWKVSARRGSLMTREYESEVPVRTWLYIDASYRARAGAFGFRPIDQLLSCAGSVAQAALSVRDPVGLVVFRETGVRRISSGLGSRHWFQLLGAMAAAADADDPPPGTYSPELLDLAWQICRERFPELIDQRVNPRRHRFWPPGASRRRELNRRSCLAAVLVELYGLPFSAGFRLERDEWQLTGWLQKFLIDQGCAWTWPVIERRSRELHDWDGKFDTLTRELSRAILHGRDNELFVLLLDLVDCSGPLVRLENVIRLARAKHHRVAVICSWPDAELAAGNRMTRHQTTGQDRQAVTRLPEDLTRTTSGPETDRTSDGLTAADAALFDQLLQVERLRLDAAAQRLRRELRRCGASVAFTTDPGSVQKTLAEADLARFGRVTHVRSGR